MSEEKISTSRDFFGRDVFEGDEIVHAAVKPAKGLVIRRGKIHSIKGQAVYVDWEFPHLNPRSKVWQNFVLLDVDVD